MSEEMDHLGEQIAEMAVHLDAAMHQLLTDLRRFDAAGGWNKTGAASCAHWLSWRVGWGLGTGREHLRVAHKLAELPRINDALRKGEVSFSKTRAMTRVATAENEETLLHYARSAPAAQLETICRKFQMVQRLAAKDPKEANDRRQLNRVTLDDGMIQIEAVLRPEEAALVWATINRAAREVAAGSSAGSVRGVSAGRPNHADGLMAIMEERARGSRPDRAPVEVVVTVSSAVLAGASEDPPLLSDGTCVSAETARRLACDAGIVDLVEGPHGEPLSVGRKTRSIPAAIKRALLHRDQTCRFPGCANRLFVEGHHVVHWAQGGETSLSNTVTLCSRHHLFVHEHGYRVELDEHQQPTFFDPRGRPVAMDPTRSTWATDAWAAIRARNDEQELELDADTARCEWDGEQVDYDRTTSELLQVTGSA